MPAQIFQHASREIAHSIRAISGIMQGLTAASRPSRSNRDMIEPGGAGDIDPRWIVSIHAAQENGTTIPVVPGREAANDPSLR